MERHHKRLYKVINVIPSLAKKACPEWAQEEPVGEAPPMIVPQPGIAGPSTMVVAQPDVAGPSSAPIVEKEACGTEAGPDTAPAEGVPANKDSSAPTASPSWDEMMEILKRVTCFMDVEAPSTKMSRLLSPYQANIREYGRRPSFLRLSLAPLRHP